MLAPDATPLRTQSRPESEQIVGIALYAGRSARHDQASPGRGDGPAPPASRAALLAALGLLADGPPTPR